ncbi:ORF3 protein [Cattle blood-associated circovirus-like virus]|uniref:ORF3 protein n=1 Tax=Cattle blood-associated circovirus-like virus TaxID=2077298 RepID=A0A2L0HH20_9VIRU|nr:ORF3 protein [Cattle blood-associated circovirus-like virus]AUX80744.1 ORF3 protein [Cattle blood-associated circovirus-like virus]
MRPSCTRTGIRFAQCLRSLDMIRRGTQSRVTRHRLPTMSTCVKEMSVRTMTGRRMSPEERSDTPNSRTLVLFIALIRALLVLITALIVLIQTTTEILSMVLPDCMELLVVPLALSEVIKW